MFRKYPKKVAKIIEGILSKKASIEIRKYSE